MCILSSEWVYEKCLGTLSLGRSVGVPTDQVQSVISIQTDSKVRIGKGAFRKRGLRLFKNVHSLEVLRDLTDSGDFRELPECGFCGTQRIIRPFSRDSRENLPRYS